MEACTELSTVVVDMAVAERGTGVRFRRPSR
jgi:hypothetical protein